MAGGFSGAVQAAGGVDSTVNFSLFYFAAFCGGGGFVRDRVLYFYRYGHLCGNGCGLGAYRGRELVTKLESLALCIGARGFRPMFGTIFL